MKDEVKSVTTIYADQHVGEAHDNAKRDLDKADKDFQPEPKESPAPSPKQN